MMNKKTLKQLSILWFIIFNLLCSFNSYAGDVIDLKEGIDKIPSTEFPIAVLKNNIPIKTVEEAYQMFLEGKFEENNINPNLGYTKIPQWFAFKINSPSEISNKWVLQIRPATLDFLQLFEINPINKEVISLKIAGDAVPANKRDIFNSNPTFSLNLKEGENLFLIRTQTTSQTTLIPQLEQLNSYEKNEKFRTIITGAYYGALIMGLVLSLIAWTITRNSHYLYFITYLSGAFLFWFSTDGYTGLYFLPSEPILANQLQGILFCLTLVISNIFISKLLLINSNNRISFFILWLINLLCIVAAPGVFFNYFSYLFPYLLGSVIVAYLVLGAQSIKILNLNSNTSVYFPIGYLIFGASNVITVLMNLGLIDANLITHNTARYSQLFFMIILHIGIYKVFAVFKQNALKSNYEIQLLNNKIKLEKQLQKDQKRLLDIFNHEIRTPIAIINASTQSLKMLDHKDTDKIEIVDRQKRYNKIFAAISRLTTLAKIASFHNSLKLEKNSLVNIDIPEAINNSLDFFKEEKKRFELNNNLNNKYLKFNKEYLDFILINLIDNAVKYSPENSKVIISINKKISSNKNSHLELIIVNEIIKPLDINLINKFKKFSRFSQSLNKPGIGMGLHLINEILSKFGHKITVKSLNDNKLSININFNFHT